MSEAVGPVSSSAAIEPDQPVADAVVPETIVPGPTVVESEPPVVDPGEPLNEIVVLDTEGSLDQVGRTPGSVCRVRPSTESVSTAPPPTR